MRRIPTISVLRTSVVLMIAAAPRTAIGQDRVQEIAAVLRGPRFFLAPTTSNPAPVEIDVRRNKTLRKVVSLNFERPTVGRLLAAVESQTGLKFFYGRETISANRTVRLRADSITVAAALMEILADTPVDVMLSRGMQIALVRRGEVGTPWQHGSIVGQVTDSAAGRGLAKVEISLTGTRWRAVTDTAGRYRLADVDTGTYTLTARQLGYAKQSRTVTVQEGVTDTVDIVLHHVATRLTDLVTTATGRRRRVDIANDITTINADSVMQTAPIRSVSDLLEGRVPGLTMQRTSGAPGDPSRLRLRGAGSPLRSNDPIVVVDGVRIYAEQSSALSANLASMRNNGTGIDTSGDAIGSKYAVPSPLDYIDPNSIETIDVLKGPSATTLYGQDAANGVIVITTKKGKPGPTRWVASVEHGRTQIAGDYPGLFLRWGRLPDNSIPIPCRTGNTTLDEGRRECIADSLVRFQVLNDPALTVLDRGHRTSASLGVSGGNGTLTYAMTGSYQEETGLPKLPDYEAERFLDRTGANPPDWMRRPQHLTQWGLTSQLGTRFGTTANLAVTTNFSRITQQRSSLEQQLGTLMSTYIDRASGTYYTEFGDQLSSGTAVTNGFLTSYYERATEVVTQFTNGLNLDWRLRSWLRLAADAGLNVDHRDDEILMPRRASASPFDSAGRLGVGEGTTVVRTVNVRGTSVLPLGRGFLFRFSAGVNYAGTSNGIQTLLTSELPFGTSQQGSVIVGGARITGDRATFGWYLEPQVGNSKLNFTSGLRLDSGTGFGSSNNFPNPLTLFTNPLRFLKKSFPKLGVSYLISDEPWFPLKNLAQSFRIRASFGKASRQPGITERLRLYDVPQEFWTRGQFVDGVLLQTLGNTQVRPERTSEFEGGFDADLLDNRLTLTVSGYRKTTDDFLVGVPVAPSVYGGGSIVKNIGKLRNTGLEFTVGAQLLRSGLVNWRADVGVSQNQSLVVTLGPGVTPFYTDATCTANSPPICSGVRVAAGYPLFGRWSPPIIGYADANGNGAIESKEIVVGDTAVYVGQTSPNYTATLGTTVGLWHGAVTVNARFRYEDGLAQRNEVAQRLMIFSRGWNDPTASLAEQAATTFVTSPFTDFNWIQVVSTTRFDDMAVSYRVPTVVARRLGAQTLSLALQGSNLGLWTNYRGIDPNVNARATGNSVTDTGVLPQPRTWQLRVSATY